MTPLGGVLATLWGFALGATYFAGLWWTVSRVGRWQRPGRALAISFVLRFLLLLGGLALLLGAGIGPLALGLLGMLLARIVMALLLRPRKGAAPKEPTVPEEPAVPQKRPAAGEPTARPGGAA